MANQLPLLGLCPIGKFVFSNEDAVRFKTLLQQKLAAWGVRYVDLEGVLEDGLVKDQAHVEPVVEHFRNARIDCLFTPHCNFGTEGAVGMIAHKLGVPVLLWGPRDEAPLADGSRLRDSLCGMFASSKVLSKLNLPFTYIENCRIDEPALPEGIDTFIRATNVADALRNGIRIGHIGQRIDFFWTTIINESELLDRFNVELLPLDMVDFINAVRERARRNAESYEKELSQLRKTITIEGFEDESAMLNILAARDEMLALAEQHDLDGLAVQEFTSLVDALGGYCCYAESCVGNTIPIGFESDIHGAISNILLSRAALGASPPYLADLTIRHPDNDNGILLWHGGAPTDLCHPDDTVRVGRHWILPSPLSGMTHFRMKDGPITAARFDGERTEYQLAVGQGHTIEGPMTLNNYLWMEVANWPHWEKTFMQGPFIHHTGMIHGRYAHILKEACKYIPDLIFLDLDA